VYRCQTPYAISKLSSFLRCMKLLGKMDNYRLCWKELVFLIVVAEFRPAACV